MFLSDSQLVALFGCCSVLVLGVIIVGVIKAFQREIDLKATGIRTTGTVVRNKICWGRTTVVRPVVRFQTQSGQTVERLEEYGVALLIPRYKAGESVQIIYNPADPSDFTIV
ncbi:DUF3592 domain-containing protein [Hymenobacter gummosus]|uniref:DUF3592 domain-containing protein n=1 Tax=Hymenobacter gummosus TaxID=1776032 RepID=A0A3S0H1B9_9BACT|nr:DUF3592 domain-containing protein [Hymenobacter gummosus]RTQ45647.1 DUF3592 domain-containing protein [Hymenobacter gummosus]